MHESPELLSYCECFVCNDIEASTLLNSKVEDDKDLCIALSKKYNLRKCVVSLGERGSVYYDRDHDRVGKEGIFKVDVKDTAGAGDTFFSGVTYGLISGYNLQKSTKIGSKVASIVIGCNEGTTCDISEVPELVAVDIL